MTHLRIFSPHDINPATRYVALTTADLQARLEMYQLLRLDALDDPEGWSGEDQTLGIWESTLDVLDADIDDLRAELARRERLMSRYASDPRAPNLPRPNDALMRLAHELKQVWPIDRFAEELMAMRLIKSGSRFRATCPLPGHRDGTPSFVLYPDQGRWHCFGCQAHGDIFDLAGHYFGISEFSEQVRKVADATGERLAVAS